MITEQIGSGDEYRNIKRAVSIIITDFVFVPENVVYHNCYTLRDPKTGSEFTDLLEVNTLELPKLPPTEDGTERWNWMKFLSARRKEELMMIAEKSPQVKKAVGRLMELSGDERVRLLQESRQKMEWDNRARERAAREEGKQEGELEGTVKVARSMLADGMAPDLISKFTGLTVEEIKALRQ
jgi:predicted transposase/invertase (TIGR01784 family)